MRKWHRWLVVFFGVFLLWIAGTGVAMQVSDLLGGEDHDRPPSAAPMQAGEARGEEHGKGPEGGEKDLHHTLQHLHSGESFGPLGVVVSTLSGLALLFFAFSGLWMYVQMWKNRASRGVKPGWFWE